MLRRSSKRHNKNNQLQKSSEHQISPMDEKQISGQTPHFFNTTGNVTTIKQQVENINIARLENEIIILEENLKKSFDACGRKIKSLPYNHQKEGLNKYLPLSVKKLPALKSYVNSEISRLKFEDCCCRTILCLSVIGIVLLLFQENRNPIGNLSHSAELNNLRMVYDAIEECNDLIKQLESAKQKYERIQSSKAEPDADAEANTTTMRSMI